MLPICVHSLHDKGGNSQGFVCKGDFLDFGEKGSICNSSLMLLDRRSKICFSTHKIATIAFKVQT